MEWYLDSPELLVGGAICIVVGGIIAAIAGGTVGRVVSSLLGFVGIVSVIYSFAGSGLRPVQFIVVCAIVIVAGVGLFSAGGLIAKGGAVILVGLAVLALINTTLTPLNLAFVDQDFSGSVGEAFRATREVIGEIFDRAQSNDPNPGQREPIS